MSESYKKESRKDWHLAGDARPDTEHLNLGCLQRIADATELMAKRYQDLIDEAERYKNSRDYWQREHERLERRLIASRGQITKLKKKLEARDAQQ